MSWTMFIAGVITIYIGLGIIIPFGFIFGYSGIMRTKINFLNSFKKTEESNDSKKSHVHTETGTNKQQ